MLIFHVFRAVFLIDLLSVFTLLLKGFDVELQADNTAILVFFQNGIYLFINLFSTESNGALHVVANLQVLYCVGSFLQHLISLTLFSANWLRKCLH